MKTSQRCKQLIKQFEGLRLTKYDDLGGKSTIGYGHCRENLPEKITQEQADKYFEEDIRIAENRVNKYLDVYNFTQSQFDGLVSFCFNIGNIDQLTKDGTRTINEIADKMLLYCKVAGQRIQGLYNRRIAERNLFLEKI